MTGPDRKDAWEEESCFSKEEAEETDEIFRRLVGNVKHFRKKYNQSVQSILSQLVLGFATHER